MNIFEIIALLVTFWAMLVGTILITFSITKDKVPAIVNKIVEVKEHKPTINEVEIVTEEMEADMEEGVMNEYYSRF